MDLASAACLMLEEIVVSCLEVLFDTFYLNERFPEVVLNDNYCGKVFRSKRIATIISSSL